jgi:hypothetical protein
MGGEKSWQDVVLADFAEMRTKGLTHSLLDEIAEAFGQGQATPPVAEQPTQAAAPDTAQPAKAAQ